MYCRQKYTGANNIIRKSVSGAFIGNINSYYARTRKYKKKAQQKY